MATTTFASSEGDFSSVPSTITTMASPTSLASEQQALTFASSIHQLCSNKANRETHSCLRIIRDLMESLSHVLMRQNLDERTLALLAEETKRVFALVTRLVNPTLPSLLARVESPVILEDLYSAIVNLHKALASSGIDWQQKEAHLLDLLRQSKNEKALLLTDDVMLHSMVQASMSTARGRIRLSKALEKHKRSCFKESVHEHRDPVQRAAAKQELQYMDQLLQKVTVLVEQATMEASLSALSMTDASIHSITSMAPTLPSWAVCPVSKKIMIDPVTVRADCNHTLSKSVFQEWLNQNNSTCPVCGCKLKALYAKVNKQLKWKLDEMENERSNATLAVPPVASTPSPTKTATRRFTTGEFTTRRALVAETNKSAAEKAPMALRGEGNEGPTASQAMEWAARTSPNYNDYMLSGMGDSISTLGVPTELADDQSIQFNVPGAPSTRGSLASVVETDSAQQASLLDSSDSQKLPKHHESINLQRQVSEQTQVVDNSHCGRRQPQVEKRDLQRNTTGGNQATKAQTNVTPKPPTAPAEAQQVKEEQLPTPPEPEGGADKDASVGGSFVHFSPTVTTKYIEPRKGPPASHVETATHVVSSYTMIDRSKRRKNPVTQLFRKIMGGRKSKAAVSSAKVRIQFHGKTIEDTMGNSSSNTAMTSDISGLGTSSGSCGISGHSRTNNTSTHPPQPTNRTSNSSNSFIVSILKKNVKHRYSNQRPKPTKPKTKTRRKHMYAEPPPLMPMHLHF